jgi:hypothetical protein
MSTFEITFDEDNSIDRILGFTREIKAEPTICCVGNAILRFHPLGTINVHYPSVLPRLKREAYPENRHIRSSFECNVINLIREKSVLWTRRDFGGSNVNIR